MGTRRYEAMGRRGNGWSGSTDARIQGVWYLSYYVPLDRLAFRQLQRAPAALEQFYRARRGARTRPRLETRSTDAARTHCGVGAGGGMATAVTRPMPRAQWSPAPGAADPIVSLLTELVDLQRQDVDLQRQILAALGQRQRPSHLTRGDEARFLLVVALAVKGRAFSAAELLAHGTADAELREVLGNLTSRQVGKRLRALSGRDVGGFTVKAVKRDGAGTIWAVYVSAHLHADAGFNADRGV